ncbi:ABC transporter permease [Acidobacteriota bacterium]
MKHKKNIKPPRIAERILRLLFAHEKKQEVLDDFEESFLLMAEDRGETRAKRWYRFQVIKIIRGKMVNKLYWSIPMFRSYFKVAIRNVRRQKVYSSINIAGLAIGIACCVLVMLYVRDELSYDQFHENKDFIYRVTSIKFNEGKAYFSPRVPWPVGKLLTDRFPEIQSFTRINPPYSSRVQAGDNIFISNYEARVDPAFIKIFTFPLIKGDSEKALDDPLSIVVTESFAQKCFGHTDVMGKTINIDNKDKQVTGVVRDVPYNSHMTFDFLVPGKWVDKEGEYDWKGYGTSTYV